MHLRPRSTILDLAGVETLLVVVLHAGEHPCATEAHRIDGALLVERHSVCDDLKRRPAARTCPAACCCVLGSYMPSSERVRLKADTDLS